MQVYFYIGEGKLFDKLIRWVTKGRYSHCELLIGDMAYSADAWTNRVRSIPKNSFNPDNWESITVEGDEKTAVAFLNSQLSKKYDWLGILGFFLPWAVNDSKRWYCSELCAAALAIDVRPVSPQDLYEILT